jgi:pilus assembly protein CpaF
MSLPAGPLAALLRDPAVTDVLVNGPHEVWADRGDGLVRERLTFASDDEVRRLAVRLASTAGRRLDAGSPFVDARLAGGVRLHAVLPPVATSGVHLSLRVHCASPLDMDTLVAAGSVHTGFAAVLESLIAARQAFVISGGAGTGKTTLLGALLARADPAERILVVEDTSELTVDHPHVVHLSARPPNVEGAGEITLRDLVRQALRMRPDRVIVGEVRGPELLDMLLAANTGHDGCLTTLHANGVADVPARIEALAMLSGVPRAAAHSLLASALRVAVHLQRSRDGRRRVGQLAVLERKGELVRAAVALSWDGSGELRLGPGAGRLRELLDAHDRPLPSALESPCSQE